MHLLTHTAPSQNEQGQEYLPLNNPCFAEENRYSFTTNLVELPSAERILIMYVPDTN